MSTVRKQAEEIVSIASGLYGKNPLSVIPAELLSQEITQKSYARIQGELERVRQKITLTDPELRFVMQLKRFVADAML